jgi:hypothetical protein
MANWGVSGRVAHQDGPPWCVTKRRVVLITCVGPLNNTVYFDRERYGLVSVYM